nr:MAG TPA: hypothetical protein [Caudoviricetes sp.]
MLSSRVGEEVVWGNLMTPTLLNPLTVRESETDIYT